LKSINEIRQKTFFSKSYLIKGEEIDFRNESIKIENVDLKGLIKIYLLINYKKIEGEEGLPNFFLLVLEEIKSLKEFNEFSWNIVNNIKIKLKLKLNSDYKTSNESIKSKNKDNILDNEKNIIKPNIHFNNGALTMKERLKLFNNNNNKKNYLPIKSEPNVKKDVPKKLIINPNLYDKEGKIKIITGKEKVKCQKRNSCNSIKESDIKESKLKKFFFGDQKEKVEKEKIVERKIKGADIPKPNFTNDIKMNNFLSKIYPKKKQNKGHLLL
jgi:hypothetical protein